MSPADEVTKDAAGRFVAHAGLSTDAAEALVAAVLEASTDQALDMITGSGPLPSNMTASRAHHLHYVCRRANRMLTQREVEVLFRATPSQARSVLVTMYATYEEALRTHFRDQMVADAQVSASGREDDLTWTIRFTESLCLDFAVDELGRLGLARWASSGRGYVTVPRKVPGVDGERDPLKDLGIAAPSVG